MNLARPRLWTSGETHAIFRRLARASFAVCPAVRKNAQVCSRRRPRPTVFQNALRQKVEGLRV